MDELLYVVGVFLGASWFLVKLLALINFMPSRLVWYNCAPPPPSPHPTAHAPEPPAPTPKGYASRRPAHAIALAGAASPTPSHGAAALACRPVTREAAPSTSFFPPPRRPRLTRAVPTPPSRAVIAAAEETCLVSTGWPMPSIDCGRHCPRRGQRSPGRPVPSGAQRPPPSLWRTL